MGDRVSACIIAATLVLAIGDYVLMLVFRMLFREARTFSEMIKPDKVKITPTHEMSVTGSASTMAAVRTVITGDI